MTGGSDSGARSPQLLWPVGSVEWELRAREALSPQPFDWNARGAGEERTLGENRKAFGRWALKPRVLTGNAERTLSVEVLGARAPGAFLLAPIGAQTLPICPMFPSIWRSGLPDNRDRSGRSQQADHDRNETRLIPRLIPQPMNWTAPPFAAMRTSALAVLLRSTATERDSLFGASMSLPGMRKPLNMGPGPFVATTFDVDREVGHHASPTPGTIVEVGATLLRVVGRPIWIEHEGGSTFEDEWVGPRDTGGLVFDLRPESIRQECEESLDRLGLERIDLYQFHWPDTETGTPIEESWGTMVDLVDEGKVRWCAVSYFGVDLLERCDRIRHVDSLQPALNLVNRSATKELVPWCREHGAGVIAYSPMASGLLTGAFSRERIAHLAEHDWRRRSPDFQEPRLSSILDLIAGLDAIARRRGVGLPALAVAWTLAIEGVTAAIVGARRPGQVDDWLPAADIALTVGDLAEIERVIETTGAGQE